MAANDFRNSLLHKPGREGPAGSPRPGGQHPDPLAQPDSVKTKEPLEQNIAAAFEQNLKALKDAGLSDEQRAIAICWLFHLAGDVYQPLHTSTFFTTDFPEGDRGGTRFYVRATAQATRTINLHAYWDNLVGGTTHFPAVKNAATELRKKHPKESLEELKARGFDAWVRESFALARKVAYRDGKLRGGRDRDRGEVLPADYAATAQPVAYRRAALAGYRLAEVLRSCLGEEAQK
jgi:hypothetical protein